MKAKGKHGGPRPGSGRPKKPAINFPEPQIEQGIDWAAVKMYAEAGGDEGDIVKGLGITEKQMQDPSIAERLRQIVDQGGAIKRLNLQVWSDGIARKGGANTIALEARNRLGWDKQTEAQEAPPDTASAHVRLKLTLERLAKVKSAELGREVTPAEILIAEVYPLETKAVH